MPQLTIKNVLKETVWVAPELMADEEFLEEWSQKHFGVGYKETLESVTKESNAGR